MDPEGTGSEKIGVIPSTKRRLHYHGDEVRILFFISAIIILVAQSTGIDLPFSGFTAVVIAIALVVVAGITNPAQYWIHWINAAFAVLGALVFGNSAIAHYRSGLSILDSSFIYIEALALLSLVALYFTTRTLRGLFQRESLM
jgi:hypothetical protein